jgi:hypothetical protein
LVQENNKINFSAAGNKQKLERLNSWLFNLLVTLLVLVFVCNWYVIYGVAVAEMPSWMVKLAQWVLAIVPGAEANVQHSWHLRAIFPYIYTVNFIFSVVVFVVTIAMSIDSPEQPLTKITSFRDFVVFHFRMVTLLGIFIFLFLVFYCGFFLEPVFEAKTLPNTSASGSALGYRMYETPLGACSIYALLYGWVMPLILALCLQSFFRCYVSTFKSICIFLFKKEF